MIAGGKIFKAAVEKFSDATKVQGLDVNIHVSKMEIKDKMLFVDYDYFLEYRQKLARITISGQIFYQGEEKRLKEIKESWEKTKRLEPAFSEEILNSVAHTGMVVGTLLSFSVGIPAPITGQKFGVSKPKPPLNKAAAG
ncbi:hypothetical protein KJ765_01630 [Candidatus Micrarchaeota archaeon]|nr:hypothetical protein [Candidatus Micrarchaeota archaeon]